MSVNAMTEEYEAVELFGKPALFTNARIELTSVPKDWFVYDLRGTDDDPGAPCTVEVYVVANHAGSILSPEPLQFPKGQDYLEIGEELNFLGIPDMTLQEFCEENGIVCPQDPQRFKLRPASPEEAGLFYASDPETDLANGCIGHVRMDFGRGEEFWHTWWPRGPEEWNSPEVKAELGEVVIEMRKSVLKDLRSMSSYCYDHGGELPSGNYGRSIYGYVAETERYRYCLRCLPYKGDYNAYLTCYDKQVQEMSQAHQTAPTMTMGGMT